MDERRQELGLTTWTEVARRAGLTPEALRLIRTKATDLQRSTKEGIERALRWAPGSVDAILDDDEPVPLDDTSTSDPTAGPTSGVDPTFDEALEGYQRALRLLRRAATTDSGVPPEIADVIDTWNTQLQALLYGGVAGVRKAIAAIAASYEHDRPGDEGSPRAG